MGRGDHLGAGGDAGQNFHPLPQFTPCPHPHRAVAAVALTDHQPVHEAGTNQRTARDGQSIDGFAVQQQAHEHPRAQGFVRVTHLHPHAQGAGFRVQIRENLHQFAGPVAPGGKVALNADGIALAHSGALFRDQFALDPDGVQRADAHEVGGGGDIHAIAGTEGIHVAIAVGVQGNGLAYGAGFDHPLDVLCGNAQAVETLAGGLDQGAVATGQRRHQFTLGLHQLRRIDLQQGLAFAHPVAHRFHPAFVHPATQAGVHMVELVFVQLHQPHRFNLCRHRAFYRGGGAHAQVVFHPRGDGHGTRSAFVAFPLIHGHQIHTHRRLARAIAAKIGVHWGDPVEDFFAAGLAIGGTRRAFILQTAPK